MTRTPYGPDELDRTDPELDRVAEALEQFSADAGAAPPVGLAYRIAASLDDEPEPALGWWAGLAVALRPWRGVARGVAAAAVVVAGVVGAFAIGELADRRDGFDVGTSPSPPAVVSPSPSASPSRSASPSASPSPSPSASPSPTEAPTAPSPSESDDDEPETPEPTEFDDDDNSGPGGGDDSGGDNSGPGGGGGGSDG